MNSTARVFAPGALRGSIEVPGDKSISHRALIVGAASPEPLTVENLNLGRDVRATLEALIALGAQVDGRGSALAIRGGRLREPMGMLDCMNSGSTARMLLGVCAGADVRAHFDGDESLRRRPVEPVAAQLRAFGAKIETTQGTLPLDIAGTPHIETTRFILITPSAQVKSALLFAALFSGTEIEIHGDRHSRDHTEALLAGLGADIEWNGQQVRYRGGPTRRETIHVAGDFSAAAFFIVAATVAPGSELTIRGVGVNPTRTGLLDALLTMGADIELRDPRTVSGERVADIVVRSAALQGATFGSGLVVRAIDEIPVLAVAAAFANGDTKISGVRELRTKESDRVAAIERLLHAAGIAVESEPNAILIHGGTPRATGDIVPTFHDHRTAMAAAALATGAGPVGIDSDASIDVSFPEFLQTLESVQQS
jgi:3-phosphoshikimate 1-carboxyvinyltransferase